MTIPSNATKSNTDNPGDDPANALLTDLFNLITDHNTHLAHNRASTALNDPAALASQAEMETGTATNRFVSPGRQHFHPGHGKGWVNFNSAGTISADYNVASITDTGTGDWTVNWETDFSSADFGVLHTRNDNVGGGVQARESWINSVAAGTTRLNHAQAAIIVGTRNASDATFMNCAGFGDH